MLLIFRLFNFSSCLKQWHCLPFQLKSPHLQALIVMPRRTLGRCTRLVYALSWSRISLWFPPSFPQDIALQARPATTTLPTLLLGKPIHCMFTSWSLRRRLTCSLLCGPRAVVVAITIHLGSWSTYLAGLPWSPSWPTYPTSWVGIRATLLSVGSTLSSRERLFCTRAPFDETVLTPRLVACSARTDERPVRYSQLANATVVSSLSSLLPRISSLLFAESRRSSSLCLVPRRSYWILYYFPVNDRQRTKES